ncbi:phage tail tip lysozyme [Streptococcus agalactiae]|uniref:phage tail tip lysozyme n=1 Tax=Streptococcus agalactiae TaxID=1311 RepID=UPI003F9B920A
MKKKLVIVSALSALVLPLFLVVIIMGAFAGSASSNGQAKGLQTKLTAKEVAQKANISEERASDVIKILNHELSQEQFTIAGASGSLAVAERESGFNPKAVNAGGGVAGYFQWSGWSSTINGNRWSKAKQKKLDSDIELDLLSTELNGSYSKVKTEMQKATDPEEAALYWSEHYEGVALSDGQTKASDLKKNARKWYNLFKDTLTGDTTNDKTRDGGGVTSDGVPAGYSLTKTINTSNYTSATYPWGQCTWFVYNRAKEVGVNFDPYMGNGGDWKQKAGYQTTHTPTEHSALSFSPGQAGSDPTYGHIAFVEQVKSDGSILISEANAKGLGIVSYRTFDKATASQFTYVIGK